MGFTANEAIGLRKEFVLDAHSSNSIQLELLDHSTHIVEVPVSGITGEGISDLLVIIAGIAQKYLKEGLEVESGEGKGTVLEVKDYKGLGTTIDVILYDGEIRKSDYLVIGGNVTIKTRVKALLKPKSLKELRTGSDFLSVDSVSAAAGIKLSAPSLEGAVAGSPLRAVRSERDVEKAEEEVREEVEEVEIETDRKGAVLHADTLGSLEALIKSLKEILPIRKAVVGNVTKSDIMEIKSLEKPVIFAFGIKPSQDILNLAKDNNVKLFHSDVIYSLIEEYRKLVEDEKRASEDKLLQEVPRPGRVRVLPGYVFRQSKPAVFGVEVMKGVIKPRYKLKKGDKVVGEIKEIQLKGENVQEAGTGDKVALSMEGVIIGKHINEGDVLDTHLTQNALDALQRIRGKLTEEEKELLDEISGSKF